jgi:hypothetical protein
MKLFLTTILILISLSCTDNTIARNYGGTETITLNPNEEFINITWKEASLWIITKDVTTGKFYAREKSPYGVLQGAVIINPSNK